MMRPNLRPIGPIAISLILWCTAQLGAWSQSNPPPPPESPPELEGDSPMPSTAHQTEKTEGDRQVQTNRLARETSPYLLQHAHNPVDWYPWGPEAFDAARSQNKPIFLS